MNTEAQERAEEARLEKRREEARMEHERGKVAAEIIASQARQIEQLSAFRRAALELLEAVETNIDLHENQWCVVCQEDIAGKARALRQLVAASGAAREKGPQ